MTLTEIFTIIIIHFVADFIMQDENWAKNKSKDINALRKHLYTYSIIWLVVLHILSICRIINPEGGYIALFGVITFLIHGITDYFTSKITSKMFTEKKYGTSIPNIGVFTVIGFDQCLHMLQLFTTYYFLMK